VVVLPDPFQATGARKKFTETQQLGHAQGLNQRSKMKEIVPKWRPKRLRCGTVENEVSQILQLIKAGTARRIIFSFYPA